EEIENGIAFSVDYVDKQVDMKDGITVLRGSQDGITALVQPTPSGVRLLTIIEDYDAGNAFPYTFEVPSGTQLVPSMRGFHLESGTEVLGSIAEPWATDSAGKPLKTWFSWSEGVLTQHVDLEDPRITYPVLLDPYWGYVF